MDSKFKGFMVPPYKSKLALCAHLMPYVKVNNLIACDNGANRITERVIQTWYGWSPPNGLKGWYIFKKMGWTWIFDHWANIFFPFWLHQPESLSTDVGVCKASIDIKPKFDVEEL